MKETITKFKLGGLIKNKYALIVLAVGLVILLWPTGSGSGGDKTPDVVAEADISAPAFSLENEEARLEAQLGAIKGAGRVRVLLSVEGTASRELAESGGETLIISESGSEKVVDLYYANPTYRGAVIVCDGAASPGVRLEITKAVTAFTGLGADKIQVIEMAEN